MLEFRGTYFTTSSSMQRKTKLLYLLHYFVHAETIWWKNEKPLPLNNLATKDLMVGWGRNPHEQKKG
jgi:hypothetical protein